MAADNNLISGGENFAAAAVARSVYTLVSNFKFGQLRAVMRIIAASFMYSTPYDGFLSIWQHPATVRKFKRIYCYFKLFKLFIATVLVATEAHYVFRQLATTAVLWFLFILRF